ncbi:uncharacterized protein LOC122936204 [Bufo gargarizans]|uniref:uncharacterized protein LOC122936204 n=1 Tax=Bufo gargarizans TaxID=30331 RepID=UPI001CF25CD4|nr:uncharacterized protein LOC122936204 [Bufo gargarizans]
MSLFSFILSWTVTFPGSGRTTLGPDSAGANNIMYRVVLPLGICLLIAGAIIIFCCYKYKAWRRRELKQATDLAMVRVEKPVVQKPVLKIKKNIRPTMDNIKKEMPIIKRLKAAKKEEEKIIKRTSKTEEEKIMKVTFKTEEDKIIKVTSKTEEEITNITSKTEKEKITMRTSRLNRFRKWIKKKDPKKEHLLQLPVHGLNGGTLVPSCPLVLKPWNTIYSGHICLSLILSVYLYVCLPPVCLSTYRRIHR